MFVLIDLQKHIRELIEGLPEYLIARRAKVTIHGFIVNIEKQLFSGTMCAEIVAPWTRKTILPCSQKFVSEIQAGFANAVVDTFFQEQHLKDPARLFNLFCVKILKFFGMKIVRMLGMKFYRYILLKATSEQTRRNMRRLFSIKPW